MNRLLVLVLLSGWLPVIGQDVLHLKSGETVTGRIDAVTDTIINLTLPVVGVTGGTARRTLPTPEVEFIEFGFVEGEQTAFAARATASASLLKSWWEYSLPHLHRPRSRTAAWGLAYADAILREEGAAGAERALGICDRVLARAWSPEDISAARQGRLRAMIAAGQLEAAITEARKFAGETDDPGLLIEVEHLLAMSDFEKLRALEEEHPRWIEDDEVRPLRNELYHRTLDGFLRPSLFHASREDAAARGLFAAAELLAFAGEINEARARWTDLTKLYPDTSYAAEAAKRLGEKPNPNP